MTLLIAVFLALVLFFGQRKLFDKNWKRKLQVSLAFGEQGVYPGELCTLKQIIQNKKRMPLPALHVKFQADKSLQFQDETEAVVTDHYYRSEVFMVGGRKQITRTLPFRPQCSGKYSIGQIQIAAQDFFMSKKYVAVLPENTMIYVYPRQLSMKQLLNHNKQVLGEIVERRSYQEDPFYFRGIRPYQPYDPMKYINWKASAKYGELLVNSFESTYSRDVCLLSDVETDSVFYRQEMQEAAISAASTLADYYLRKGARVSFRTNGREDTDEEIVLEQCQGITAITALNRRLAGIDLAKDSADFARMIRQIIPNCRQSRQYVCITTRPVRDILEAVTLLQSKAAEVLLIVPQIAGEEVQIPAGALAWNI